MRGLAGLVALFALLLVAPSPASAQSGPLYGETYLVSTSSEDELFGDDSDFEAISKDGLWAFWTTTESLLSADSDNGNVDIYARNIDARTTQLVTPGGDFDAEFLGASQDGSKVFFSTLEPIVGDSDSTVDIYRRNLDAVPPTTTNMTPGTDEQMYFGDINLAGDRLFFETYESLIASDTDNEKDVYMSQGGGFTRISTGSNGGNDDCNADYAGSTPDGLNVFFSSRENLTGDDGWNPEQDCASGTSDQGSPDIFHWSNGSVVNRTPQLNAFGAPDRFAAASLDGSRVIYNANQNSCDDDVFQSIGTAQTKLSPSQWDDTPSECSEGQNAQFLDASADATKVYWVTREPGMAGASDDNKDIFRTTNGGPPELMSPNTPSDDADINWTTPDGSHLFFGTSDPVTDDTDATADVFQNVNGTITKISKGPLGGNGSHNAYFGGATDDGDYVFFSTSEPLTSDDSDASGGDLFVRHNGATELISTGPRGETGNYGGTFAGVSEDAERVFFTSSEKLVNADTDQEKDVYMRWVGGPPSVRIDELALTPDSFVELLKSGEGQDEFPDEQGPYKIVVYDGDGDEIGEHVITTELLRGQARPLFSDTHPDADEPLEVALPAVGQMCFTQGAGELLVDCVAWGCIATPVQQDIAEVAPPGANLSQQRQGDNPEVFHLASPTPKDVNISGTTPEACPSDPDPDPDPDDTVAPDGTAKKKGKGKAGKKIKVEVSSNELAEVVARGIQKQTKKGKKRKRRNRATVTATVKVSKKKLKVKLKPARTKIGAGQTKTLKLKPKGKKAAKKLRRAVRKKGAKAKAKIKVFFTDEAGNRSKEKLSFRLR